mmetsp:Transcript_5128/g.18763  ORF Transcript_5128/g.18763 Transcript_5128/m.18763 type:complete len:425 (-) Transcript_5128:666-1940(-)
MSLRHARLLHSQEMADVDHIPDNEKDAREYLKTLTKYDASRFANERPEDTDDMESGFGLVAAEEDRTAKIGAREDWIEELREQGRLPQPARLVNSSSIARPHHESGAPTKASKHREAGRTLPSRVKMGASFSSALAEMRGAKLGAHPQRATSSAAGHGKDRTPPALGKRFRGSDIDKAPIEKRPRPSQVPDAPTSPGPHSGSKEVIAGLLRHQKILEEERQKLKLKIASMEAWANARQDADECIIGYRILPRLETHLKDATSSGQEETMAKVRELLRELQTLNPCTEAIVNTRIGKLVKKFLKCSDYATRKLAIRLTSAWKEKVLNDDKLVMQKKRELQRGSTRVEHPAQRREISRDARVQPTSSVAGLSAATPIPSAAEADAAAHTSRFKPADKLVEVKRRMASLYRDDQVCRRVRLFAASRA